MWSHNPFCLLILLIMFFIHLTKHKKNNKIIFVVAVASHNDINNSPVSEVR